METTNAKDSNVVAIIKDGRVVRHVLFNIAPRLSKREVNKAFVEVTGMKVIEVPAMD